MNNDLIAKKIHVCRTDTKELKGTEWLHPPGAPSTGRAPKGALQR